MTVWVELGTSQDLRPRGAGGDRGGGHQRTPAPGVDLVSTYLSEAWVGSPRKSMPFNGFARWKGTSFAAALVSGLIAAGMAKPFIDAREKVEVHHQDARG